MVRMYTQHHTYHHPWPRVTAASLRKFTDPSTTSVLSHILHVHTLTHRLDPSTSSLHVTRSITVQSPPLPFILRRLLAAPSLLCHCLESTTINPVSRSMEVVTVNSSLRSVLEVEERSTYSPHPQRPDDWTVLEQETRITCRPLAALAAVAEKVEQRCAERFLQNSAKGRELVERICDCLKSNETTAPRPNANANDSLDYLFIKG